MQTNPKILIVEDAAVQAELLRRTLVKNGYEIFTTRDGKEALSQISSINPSLVISDILMPIMDGYELCRQIKLDENLQHIPVILLTGLKEPNDIIKALEVKADSFISKPYDKQHLLTKIKNLIVSTPSKQTFNQKSSQHTILFGNEAHIINSSYQQIFDLLIDTYENIIIQNKELTNQKEELMESEERFKFLVQSIPDVIYKINTNGIFTFVNNSIRSLGYEPEEIIGRHFSELIFKDDVDTVSRDKVLPKYDGKITGDNEAPKLFDERRGKNRKTHALEVRLIAKESKSSRHGILESFGEDIVFSEVDSRGLYTRQVESDSLQFNGTLGIIQKKSAQFIGTTGVIRDITERKKIEDTLLSDKSFLENILSNITNGICVLNSQGIIVMANQIGAKICKYTVDDLIGCHYSKILKSAEFESHFNKVFKTGSRSIKLVEKITYNDGLIRFFNICPTPLSVNGRIANIVAVIEDITVRKEKERFQNKSIEYYKNLFENSKSIMLLGNPETGDIIDANEKACSYYGYSKDELISKHISDISTLSEPEFYSKLKMVNEQGVDYIISKDRLRSGEIRDVEIYISPVTQNGKTILFAIVHDITEKIIIEQQLRLHSEIISNMSEGIILVKVPEGVIVYSNQKFEDMLGYQKGELIGINVVSITAPTQISPEERAREIMEELFRTNHYSGEVCNIKKDKTHVWNNLSVSKFNYSKYGDVWIAIHADITERKKMEEQLRNLNTNLESMILSEISKRQTSEQILIQQSKMASLGEMIGLIAHQWKQPLNAVSLIVQDLNDAYSYGELDDKYIHNSVKSTMEQVTFMSKTIDDFRTFFIPSKRKIIFDVNSTIEELLSMFKTFFRKNNIDISLKISQQTSLLTEGYPNEFKQVVLNILNNSKDAIVSKKLLNADIEGRIEINLGNTEDKTKISVLIIDNGGGIPEEIIDKIFEPYYTTKESTGGTGVGLYMSKTIIETNMGGTLTVRNIGDGAEFIITLDIVGGDS